MFAGTLARDRLIVLTGLGVFTLLAWAYTVQMAGEPLAHNHGARGFFVAFGMWTVMMAAMMLPSATTMVLTYAGAKRRGGQAPFQPTTFFVLGYLFAWGAFSGVAALVQQGLQGTGLLSMEGASVNKYLSAVILVGAGLFQWSDLKHRCLAKCRSPLGFMLTEWRDGLSGAFHMGAKHGLHCLGCCWALMLLVFFAGVMNLLWGIALTALVLVEKVAPGGAWIARAVGVGLVATGLALPWTDRV